MKSLLDASREIFKNRDNYIKELKANGGDPKEIEMVQEYCRWKIKELIENITKKK